jgi:aryl-alcohol dehydrogenase-like predicted oxidoreductase
MEYRFLGQSKIKVSVIGFGAWAIGGGRNWGYQPEKEALEALKFAYEQGINFFDTAPGYGDGHSEKLIGQALKPVRDKIVVATKISPRCFESKEIEKACETSLKNLNFDWIDLYQLHWPNESIPLEETLSGLERLKEVGKIKAYGFSNFGVKSLKKYLSLTGYSVCSNQLAYSLLFRAIEEEILPLCKQAKISVLCYSPLIQGLLTGKFKSANEVPVERARTRHFSATRPYTRHGEGGVEKETFSTLGEIQKLAEKEDFSMTDLALGWLLAQPGVASVIVGIRSKKQVSIDIKAGEITLSKQIIQKLSTLTQPLKQKLGPNADLWEANSRVV